MPRCKATNRNGEPCGSPEHLVDPGTGLCHAHAPGGREKMRERARKGAEATRKRWQAPGMIDDLPPLRTPRDAEEWLEAIGRAVACGDLSSSAGNIVVRSVREWLRAHAEGETAERVAALEEGFATLRRSGLKAG